MIFVSVYPIPSAGMGQDRREEDEEETIRNKNISDIIVGTKKEQGQPVLFLPSDRSSVSFNDPVVECIFKCFCHAF